MMLDMQGVLKDPDSSDELQPAAGKLSMPALFDFIIPRRLGFAVQTPNALMVDAVLAMPQ